MRLRDILGGVLAAAMAGSATAAMAATPEEIFSRSAAVEKLPDWQAKSTLEIHVGSRRRVRAGTVYNRLTANGVDSERLFRFSVPADVAGAAVLVHEHPNNSDDLWIYFPSMAKTRRILASNKKDSFMGSDFAYADLMTQRSDEFTHHALPSQPCGDKICYVIESVPKSSALAESIGYGKIISSIRSDDYLTHQIRYFDRQQREIKIQTVSGYVPIAATQGKYVAARREMRLLKDGRMSVLTMTQVAANRGLDSALFQEARMGQ